MVEFRAWEMWKRKITSHESDLNVACCERFRTLFVRYCYVSTSLLHGVSFFTISRHT